MGFVDKLSRVFNRLSPRRLTPIFAASAMLAAGCQSVRPSVVAPPEVRPPKVTDVSLNPPLTPPVTKMPGRRALRGTPTDLLERNRGDRPPVADEMTDDIRLKQYISELCFEIGDPDVKTANNEGVRLTLGEVAEMTLLGQSLVNIADQMNVKFCGLNNLSAGVAALYYPHADLLITRPARSKYDLVTNLVHEMMHAAQDQNGLFISDYGWDIESRLQHNLSVEAAAATAEMLIAYEAYLRGKDDYWLYLNTSFGNAAMDKKSLTILDQTYCNAMAVGASHQDALMLAGRKAFENVFQHQGWLSFYCNQELVSYAFEVTAGLYDRPFVLQSGVFDQNKLNAAGQIGFGGLSFTAAADIPGLGRVLQTQPQMYFAFQAVEVERVRRSFGYASPEHAQIYNQAVAEKNPYLGLDIGKAVALHRAALWGDGAAKTYRYLYHILMT